MSQMYNFWSIMVNMNARLMELQRMQEAQLSFLRNRGLVTDSTLERLDAVRGRNPSHAQRVDRLREIFLSRVNNAGNMDEVSTSLRKLLKTLDRERLY